MLGSLIWRLKIRWRKSGGAQLHSFQHGMSQANIVVAAGGGYLNDMFPNFGRAILRGLEWAIQMHKPTFMLSQGIGSLTHPRVLAPARAVLPRIDLIALRERRAGLPLLRSLGVDDRIQVTGDDTIEAAYAARRQERGNAIGVNLRRARYAGETWAVGGRVVPLWEGQRPDWLANCS